MKRRIFAIVAAAMLLAGVIVTPLAEASTLPEHKTWKWENPWPQGNTIRSVWRESTTSYYLTGELGTVSRFKEGTWTFWHTGVNQTLLALWGVSEQSLYAVGTKGTILHFDGNNWAALAHPAPEYDLTGVWGTSDTNVFAVGRMPGSGRFDGIVLHFDGEVWSRVSLNLKDFELHGIWGSSSGHAWAVGFHYANQSLHGIVLYYDGAQWSVSTGGTYSPLYDVSGNEDGSVFAAGSDGTILRFDGSAWTLVSYDSSLPEVAWSEFRKISVGPDGSLSILDIWRNRILCFTQDQWYWIGSPEKFKIWDLVETPLSGLTIFGQDGDTYRYEQGQWRPQTYSLTTETLRAVHGTGSGNLYAVGDHGRVLQYDGATCFVWETGVDVELRGVWHAPWSAVYAVGRQGTILVNEGGLAWNPMDSGVQEDLNAVWGGLDTDVFAVGDKGTVLHYDGKTWRRVPVGVEENLNAVWTDGFGSTYVVGDRGTILVHNKLYWRYMNSGTQEDLHLIRGPSTPVSGRFPIAMGNGGTVLVLSGENWNSISPDTDAEFRGLLSDFRKEILAVTSEGRSWHFDGTDWSQKYTPISFKVFGSWDGSGNELYVVGEHGAIARLSDDTLPIPGIMLKTDKHLYESWEVIQAYVSAENRGAPVTAEFHLQLSTSLPHIEVYSLTQTGWVQGIAPMFEELYLFSGFRFQGRIFSIQASSENSPILNPGTYLLSAGFYDSRAGFPIGSPSTVTIQLK